MNGLRVSVLGLSCLVSGCAGLLTHKAPVPDVYRLRATTMAAGPIVRDGVLRVARPRARAGLESDHLVVEVADHRQDWVADARWSAPLPQVAEGLLIDSLRSRGLVSSVVSEQSPFQARYLLRIDIVECAVDLTDPTQPRAHVVLSGEIGVQSERQLLATVGGRGEALAPAERRHDLVSAYQAAWDAALMELVGSVSSALKTGPTP